MQAEIKLYQTATSLLNCLFQARKVRYYVCVCWEEVVYSDFNCLTATLFTLSIEVLVTSQKSEISCICVLEGKGGN